MTSNVDDTTGLSRFFHLNSEPWTNENPGSGASFLQKTKTYPHADRVALPDTDRGALDELAASRHSDRSFSDAPLSLADLARLLRSAYAALGPDMMENGQKFLRRPVPSAGGLYPLELYALVRNVDGLAKSIYHYDTIGDALETVSVSDWEPQARHAFHTWSFVKDAPVVLCIGAVFDRNQAKYGPRGYRYILLEAGHVVQNICLRAAELGLGSLCMGGYQDSLVNPLIGLDGVKEAVIYSVAVGAAQ
ncbi:SagB/ThcOx family dehydrogenase [Yoonia sp. BS5-3]|uniref:SagB/ThcOx family dehydrogenase n=1 Tax=Yoonia phaeophyticola TaxID=3137369 RepID=A0ABZ2V5L1_9RHOB